MADDWAVGDLALCVNAGPCALGYVSTELVEGRAYHVAGVGIDPNGDLGLFLNEIESKCWAGGYLAWRFRKIRPLTDEERDSFLADLDAPVSPAVPDGRRPVTAQRGTGHFSPAAPLLASLPDPSAAHTPCLADGSGFSDHRFHVAEVTDQ